MWNSNYNLHGGRQRPYVLLLCRALIWFSGLFLADLAASAPPSIAKKKKLKPTAPSSEASCGPIALEGLIVRIQNFDRTAASEGERIATKCKNESYEALQWTSFLYAISGETDRARTIDRLWIKPPSRKVKPVERTLQLARAGSPQLLRDKLSNFDAAYMGDPRNRLTLGRALARAGEIDAARREYYTYLAARPSDEVAEIEYLYLNIWAGDGALALNKFLEAKKSHTSKYFLETMDRGIHLVYKLWPLLAPKPEVAAALTTVVPAEPMASIAPLPTVAPLESKVNAEVKVEDKPEKGRVLGLLESDQVPEFFSMAQMNVRTEGMPINPELYGLRTQFTALNQSSVDSAGFALHKQWSLHESILAGAALGWFASPVGGLATGRVYFSALVPSDIQLGATISRRPLALDIPMVKQDMRIARDAIEAQISWRQLLSWRGTIESEAGSIPHERHDGLLRWGFSGDCALQRCLDFFVPIQWERYQTISPYYYHDDERVGFGPGIMARIDVDKRLLLYTKATGKLVAWQALLSSGDIENYSLTELSLELGWQRDHDRVSVSYDWRRTSSERSFRKYEAPNSLMINAGMGL